MSDADHATAGTSHDGAPLKVLSQERLERRQRLKEYRTAARRERRNRKADEKKQRKLNATILRRMTRDTERYTKNASRNTQRDITMARRKIQNSAVRAVQRLAAVHDPSGKMFNVPPVTFLEDGSIITVEALNNWKESQRRKEAIARGEELPAPSEDDKTKSILPNVNPERVKFLEKKAGKPLSKKQLKKLAALEPRPEPPKPILPEGMELPPDEEENWLALWDLRDDEIEKRIAREKKKAAQARRDFRALQKAGKTERRAARDEKRRIYRDLKETWKSMRAEEKKWRKRREAQEKEEGKRLAIQLARKYRADAMEAAARLGFTLENVPGVDTIKPKALTVDGVPVNFDVLEPVGDQPSGLRSKVPEKEKPVHSNRVDLGAIADESATQAIFGTEDINMPQDTLNNDFVSLNEISNTTSNATDHKSQSLSLNNRTRRKLRQAIESAQVKKELLVRAAAIQHCKDNNIPIPPALETPHRPVNRRGSRTTPNGTLETAKQERVRAMVELAEFNRWAKVLRRQAKEKSIEAGIRVYLELTGRIPKNVTLQSDRKTGDQHGDAGVGEMMNVADIIASWPMPELGEGRFGTGYDEDIPSDSDEDEDDQDDEKDGDGGAVLQDSSEDSASKQLLGEMRRVVKKKQRNELNVASESEDDDSSDSDSDSDDDSDTDSNSDDDSDSESESEDAENEYNDNIASDSDEEMEDGRS